MIRMLIASAVVWALIVVLLWVTWRWDEADDDRPTWHKRPHE